MPLVSRWDGDENPVAFPITGHLTTAEEALTFYEASLKDLAQYHGGAVQRLYPKRDRPAHGLRWTIGPENWAQICAESVDMETESFTVFHENGDTIFFQATGDDDF